MCCSAALQPERINTDISYEENSKQLFICDQEPTIEQQLDAAAESCAVLVLFKHWDMSRQVLSFLGSAVVRKSVRCDIHMICVCTLLIAGHDRDTYGGRSSTAQTPR